MGETVRGTLYPIKQVGIAGKEKISIEFAVGADGSVSTLSARRAKGVTAVAKTATGVYKISLKDSYYSLTGCLITVVSSSAKGYIGELAETLWNTDQHIRGSSPYVKIRFVSHSGGAFTPVSCAFKVDLELTRKKLANNRD